MTQSTWVEIPASRRDARPSRWRKLALRLLLPLAFAVVLWLLGLEIAAVLVVVAVTLLAVIGVVSPTLSTRHRAPDGAVRGLRGSCHRLRVADHREPVRLHAGRLPDVGVPVRRAGAGGPTRRGVVLARPHRAIAPEAPVRRRAHPVEPGRRGAGASPTGPAGGDRRGCGDPRAGRRPRRRLDLRRGEQRDPRDRRGRRRHVRPGLAAGAARQPVGRGRCSPSRARSRASRIPTSATG